jgi:inner membrane protein
MDNLTHSLVGALLGQMGLKRKTGLAMPTLIIAANIPDLDVVALALGGHQHLAIRRGITHGPIAWVILPILLWAVMLWFDSWQTKQGTRPQKRLPIHKGWLLALAFIGCLSHPAFDWLNNYGVRLLEPFSHQWFYGDSIFIIDIWMLAILGLGTWFSLRRERAQISNWQRPAITAFLVLSAYIFTNGAITGYAEAQAMQRLQSLQNPALSMPDPLVVASPKPVLFWQRDIFWRDDVNYGTGFYGLGQKLSLDTKGRPHGADKLALSHAQMAMEQGPAYLFWSRMPVVEQVIGKPPIIRDQRFTDPRVGDRFTLKQD